MKKSFYAIFIAYFVMLQSVIVTNAETYNTKSINSTPLQEDFEDSTFPPAGWTIETTDASGDGWSRNDGSSHGPGSVNGGSYAAMADVWNISKNETAQLISPVIDLSALSQPKLEFYWQCTTGYGMNPALIIKVSTDGGATYTEIYNQEADGTFDTWKKVSIELPEKSDQTKILFEALSDYGSKNLFIDDVKVYEPAPMTFKNASVVAQAEKDVAKDSKDNEIIGFKITTEGGLNKLPLDKISINLNGTTSITDIENVKIYSTGSSNQFSTQTLWGENNSIQNSMNIIGSTTLAEGDNYFWVAFDVAQSATAENVLDAEVIKVQVNSEEKTVNPSSSPGVKTIKSMLNMPNDTHTFTVNGNLNFYDDGGKDNNYSEDFEGILTFTPAGVGKIIKIDWNKFDVFNTSSIGKNDIFKIYNGKTANEDSLIGEYSNTPPTTYSMAKDGSITIYFKVKTGIPKSGWEAVVSEIIPQNMVFLNQKVSQKKNVFAFSGSENKEILQIEIETQNTKNPLTLTSLNFDTNGTTNNSDLVEAKIYYTGNNNNFTTENLIGSLDNPAGNFTISSTQSLTFGKNYVWLCYDISTSAQQDNILDAECNSFVLSGTTHTITNTAPAGNVKIDNTYRMPLSGTHEKIIYQKIQFTDDNKGYNGKYSSSAMATVTFIPAKPDEKIKIDISDFEILYQKSSYGTKAYFRIFNGNSTASSDLLWKADDSNATTGPGSIITSSADDGSLTVKFVANAYSSSQTKAGWQADVWSEKPQDMKFDEAFVSQNTEIIKPGSINQEILQLNIKMKGTLNAVQSSTLTFSTEGTTNLTEIDVAKLFFTGKSSVFDTETQLSTSVVSPTESFGFVCSQTLSEGDNYFWLTYDINSNATIDNLMDATFTKFQYNDTVVEIENGAPAGARKIKNIYNAESGRTEIVVNENPLNFYDDGGIDNKYKKNNEITVVFIPQNPAQKVKIDLQLMQLYSMDKITVYNGDSEEEENLIFEKDGEENITNANESYIVKSTSDDGKLTFKFKSYSWATPKDGWEALVQAFVPQPIAYHSAETTHPVLTSIIKGEQSALISKVKLQFKGETASVTLSALSFSIGATTQKADIEQAKLYYSADVDEFNIESSQLLGETTADADGVINFNKNVTIDKEGSYYFWLTYDIASSATTGNNIDASLVDIVVNGETNQPEEGNPAGVRRIMAGMKGEFTIDATGNGDFESFSEAVNALKKGIEGAVSFVVENGVYVEKIEIPQIQGTSQNNTITFKAKSGNKEDVLLTNNISGGGGYNAPKIGVVKITGADFLTFKNIRFKTLNESFDATIVVENVSRNLTFESCDFVAKQSTGYSGASCFYTKAINEANKNNDHITINNCQFIGGATALHLSGTGYVKLPKEKGHIITNCTFKDFGRKAVFLDNQKDIVFKNNIILAENEPTNDIFGLVGFRIIGNSEFSYNTLNFSVSKEVIGFQFRPATGTVSQKVLIYNNMININNSVDYSYGIELDDACSYVGIYHNTVRIEGDNNKSAAIRFSGRSNEIPEEVDIKNNIFVNTANGLAASVLRDAFKTGLQFNYNNLFSSVTDFAKIGATAYSDIAIWKTAVSAQNSISENVEFYGSEDLRIKTVGNLNSGTSLDAVKDDIDGEARSTTPTMGADEFSAPTNEAPNFAAGYPKAGYATHYSTILELKCDKNGKAYYLVLPANSPQPSIEQITNGKNANDEVVTNPLSGIINFYKNKAKSYKITNLDSQTAYKIYIVVEDNLGNRSSEIKTVAFNTHFKPNEPSTFEMISTGKTTFNDGTAYFEEAEIVEENGVDNTSFKIAKISANQTGKITLTNTNIGRESSGFFIKATSTVTVKSVRENGSEVSSFVFNPSGDWEYVSLKEIGNVYSIELVSSADFYIDNFNALPLELTIEALPELTINDGEQQTVVANVTGGVKPYQYQWSPATTLSSANTQLTTLTPNQTTAYTVKVTDKYNKTVSTSFVVKVIKQDPGVATFENLTLPDESYWIGDKNKATSYFYSGSFRFNNFFKEDIMTWGNFAYSNETNTDFDPSYFLTQQFRSAVGKGAMNSQTYGVVYAYGNHPEILLTNTTEGETLKGVHVTNNAYAKNSMENGDSFVGDAFKKGDWYKVTFTGKDKNGSTTGVVECYLADYQDDNPENHYILDYWKWIDLSDLGKVTKVYVSVSGSRNNKYGLLTPGYLCIDNFNSVYQDAAPYVANPISDINAKEDDSNLVVDINKVFSDTDNDDKKIEFSVKNITNPELLSVTYQDNQLIIALKENQSGKSKITLQGKSNGKTVEDEFWVNVDEVDDAPYVKIPISNVSVDENAKDMQIDLSNLFADSDKKDSIITMKVLVNSKPELVTASIVSQTMTLQFAKNQHGKSDIIIEGDSKGKKIRFNMIVTVRDIDNTPEIANPLSDITVLEDAEKKILNLNNVFFDADGDEITLSIIKNSNPELFNASIVSQTMEITFVENQFGEGIVVLKGESNAKFVTDTIKITVTSVDDAPFLKQSFSNFEVYKNAKDTVFNLQDYFGDIDSEINYDVTIKDNSKLVSSKISENQLTLSFKKDTVGEATVNVTALSKDKKIETFFDVNILIPVSTEINQLRTLSVYPVPFKDYIIINDNSNITGATYCFYNANGQKILTGKIVSSKERINTAHLLNGIYFIQIEKEGTIFTKKIIK